MTTTADTILAVDLGRFKSVVCVYSRSSHNRAFRTMFPTRSLSICISLTGSYASVAHSSVQRPSSTIQTKPKRRPCHETP